MIPEAKSLGNRGARQGTLYGPQHTLRPKAISPTAVGSDLLTHDDTCCAAHCGSALTRLSPFPGHPACGGLVRTDLFEQHSQIDM